MNLTLAQPKPAIGWGTGLVLVSSVYGSLLAWLLWQPALPVLTPVPAAAVMLVMAPQISSASTLRKLATGVQQSVATARSRPAFKKTQKLPSLAPAQAPVIIAAAAEAATRAEPEPAPSPANNEPPAPATANSSAAPAPAALSAQAAAPFNSDSNSALAANISWQSLVLNHLGKYKRYPGDARQRHKAGAAWVKFTVNRQGQVLSSQLVNSSGTPVLDREALQLLERAQPLPVPPEQMIRQGKLIITLPIHFNLENNRAA